MIVRYVAIALGLLAVGLGLAAQPLLAAGSAVGALLLFTTVSWPLAMICAMLGLGPVSLAFFSGGQKQLLPALGGLDLNGIRLVGLSIGLGLVILTRRELLKMLGDSTARWYVIFLLWAAATLSFSPSPLDGARLLLKLAYPLLFFLIIAAPERRPDELHRLGDWTLWGAVAVLLIDPLFVANGSYFLESDGWVRFSLPGSHQNPFSFYLLVIVVLSVGRFRARGQTRYLVLGATAAVWIALTLTRITFLAFFVAMAVLGAHAALARGNRKVLIPAAGFAALLGTLALGPILARTFGHVPSPSELAGLLTDPIRLYHSINWQGREQLWTLLGIVFLQSPFWGSGIGTSSVALAGLTIPNQVAHNEYLRLAVDTGLVGCSLYFLAVLAWIRAAARTLRTRSTLADEYGAPTLALIAGWAVIALTDNAFDYYGPLTQYVAFLAAASVVVARPTAAAIEPATVVNEPALVA
jgi:O-antigen ligase